jgi:hypothetical protein
MLPTSIAWAIVFASGVDHFLEGNVGLPAVLASGGCIAGTEPPFAGFEALLDHRFGE